MISDDDTSLIRNHIVRLRGNTIIPLPHGNLRFLVELLKKENVDFDQFPKLLFPAQDYLIIQTPYMELLIVLNF